MNQAEGDPVALLERALNQATAVVGAVTPEQMSLPTPCEDWDVRQLVQHMSEALNRNLRLLGGEAAGQDASSGAPEAEAYRARAQAVLEAWRRPGAMEGTYQLPFGTLPGPAFAGLTAMETVIHTWDLAKATGQTAALDPRLAEVVLGMATRAVPAERGAGMPFKPAVVVPADAPAYDRLAGYLGRQP
jgi:uncharacterized protein (TIGR03086 family)